MRLTKSFLVAAAALVAILVSATESHGEPRSRVLLNGQSVPVFFNDGDSFRVLSGSKKGAKARIAGYNTLETHGAVHSWGGWTTKEMYVLAKMATLHARRGVWECTTDGKTDTYGRMLTFCPKLAEDLVRRGLAHAMSVNDDPADPTYLKAQHEAMEARRGIWAHGIPDFVLTSIHSAEEDVSGRGTYNRLVSSDDGHSVKWKHTSNYEECDNVCHLLYVVDDDKIDGVIKSLKKDKSVGEVVSAMPSKKLEAMVTDYARYRHINRSVGEDDRSAVKAVLDGYAKKGRFGEDKTVNGSCMVHVPFERRFGGNRAICLR